MHHAYRSWHWYFLCQPADFPERAINKAPEVFFERRPTNIWSPEARADYWRCYQNPDTIRAICEDYRAGITVDFEDDKADLGKKKIQCPMLALWGSRPSLAAGRRLPRDLARTGPSTCAARGLTAATSWPRRPRKRRTPQLRAFFAEG